MSLPRPIAAPSPNWDERAGAIDMIVVHYTGMASGEAALRRLTDPAPTFGAYAPFVKGPSAADPGAPAPRVSAHYLVEEDGRVFQLVDEAKRAWHAGVAFWDGATDVNARSVGIEIVNGGHDFGLPPFPDAQVEAVVSLCRAISARHGVAPWRVVGHSDVAPERKRDPGPRFPWARLHQAGLAWGGDMGRPPIAPDRRLAGPGSAGEAVHGLQSGLAAFGYGLAQTGGFDARTEAVVRAFHDRFAPAGRTASRPEVWTAADQDLLETLNLRRARAERA